MEARAEFRQPRISKSLVAVVALSIALGLGVMAGTVAKNNGSAATTQTHSISQGQGGSALQSVRHGGMQAVEENAAVSTSVGPDDRAATSTSLAPIAGRGVSPDAADRKAGLKTGNAFVAPDAADHNTAAPKYFAPDALGYREG